MVWDGRRPRCLERVLAPENFPTTTTAAEVMIDPFSNKHSGAGAETDLPSLFCFFCFSLFRRARIGPTTAQRISCPGSGFGVV